MRSGINELKEMMEDVPLNEISKRDIEWCTAKWKLIIVHAYECRHVYR